MSSFYNTTKAQRIIGIVERLRLRSSNRLTVNVIRNQQRNRITLDETNIALSQLMEYDFSPLVGLRRGFTSIPKEVLNVLLGASRQFPEISAPHLLTVVILPEGVDVISGNQPCLALKFTGCCPNSLFRSDALNFKGILVWFHCGQPKNCRVGRDSVKTSSAPWR